MHKGRCHETGHRKAEVKQVTYFNNMYYLKMGHLMSEVVFSFWDAEYFLDHGK